MSAFVKFIVHPGVGLALHVEDTALAAHWRRLRKKTERVGVRDSTRNEPHTLGVKARVGEPRLFARSPCPDSQVKKYPTAASTIMSPMPIIILS